MWIWIAISYLGSAIAVAELFLGLIPLLVGAIVGEVTVLLLLWQSGLFIALLGAPLGGAVLGVFVAFLFGARNHRRQ